MEKISSLADEMTITISDTTDIGFSGTLSCRLSNEEVKVVLGLNNTHSSKYFGGKQVHVKFAHLIVIGGQDLYDTMIGLKKHNDNVPAHQVLNATMAAMMKACKSSHFLKIMTFIATTNQRIGAHVGEMRVRREIREAIGIFSNSRNCG